MELETGMAEEKESTKQEKERNTRKEGIVQCWDMDSSRCGGSNQHYHCLPIRKVKDMNIELLARAKQIEAGATRATKSKQKKKAPK